MLSNRSIWRKWLLLFTCWSLISSMAFVSVSAADEHVDGAHSTTSTVETTPQDKASSVQKPGSHSAGEAKGSASEANGKNLAEVAEGVSSKRAAAGASGFRSASNYPAAATERSAGQDRSAGTERAGSGDIGTSNYQPDDGVWTLSSAGEITNVKYENGKYVAKESRDIPFYTRSCSPPYNISGSDGDGNSRGVFDGLAISPDKSTMYAVHSYSNATRANEIDTIQGGASLYRYKNGRWNTWVITGSEGHWKITEKAVNWNRNCSGSGGSRTATHNPTTRTPKGAKDSPRNYTFDNARTNFTSGTIINAGTPNEAYIFGGTDSTRFVGSGGTNNLKIFSFQPGTTGGVVKYLGYIPFQQYGGGPQTAFGDFTTDKEGNLYAGIGQGSGNDLNLKVYKFSNSYITSMINGISPLTSANGRQFTFSGRYHWNGGYNFDNNGCGATGGFNSNNNCTQPLNYDDPIISTNIPFDKYVDGFSGFSIAPGNKITVGAKLSNGQAGVGTHGVVVEIDGSSETKNDKAKVYDSLKLNASSVHDATNGLYNQEHTDVEGALSSPGVTPTPPPAPNPPGPPTPPPAPEVRKIQLKKTLNRAGVTDEFSVGLFDNRTGSAIVSPENTDGRSDGTFSIGSEANISTGPVEVRFEEYATSTSAKMDNYEISVSCTTTDGRNVPLHSIASVVKGVKSWKSSVRIPAAPNGDLICTVVNKGTVAPTPPPTQNKVTVKLYKQFVSAYDQTDRFEVGIRDYLGAEKTLLNATTTGRVLAATKQVLPGQGISLYETALSGSVDNYNSVLSCYRGDQSDPSAYGDSDFMGQAPGPNVTLTVAETDNVVSCFYENTAKTKLFEKTVTIFKHFDQRFAPGDNFEVDVFDNGNLHDRISGVTDNASQDGNHPNELKTGKLPANAFITVTEVPAPGSNANLRNYGINITCNEVGTGKVLTPYSTPLVTSADFDLSEATTESVECHVYNTAKSQKTVHLHKIINGEINAGDVFRLGFQGVDNPSSETTNGMTANSEREITSMSIPAGTQIGILESPVGNTNMQAYDSSLVCYNGAKGSPQHEIVQTADPHLWGLTVKANDSNDINCYVTNTKKHDPRTLTIKKIFKNTDNTNGFTIKVGSDSPVSTAGHNVGEAFVIKQAFGIPGGDYPLSLEEEAADPQGNGRPLEKFTISVQCEDSAGLTHTIEGSKNGYRRKWFTRDQTIPAAMTGAITCTITNELPAPDTKVVLYKDINRVQGAAADQFDVSAMVSTKVAPFDYGYIPRVNTGTLSAEPQQPGALDLGAGYQRYKIGEMQSRPKGDLNLEIKESATNGAELSDYDSSVTCRPVREGFNREDQGTVITSNQYTDVDGKFRTFNLQILGTLKGELRCYLNNKPKPSKEVVLYKEFKSFKDGDHFSVGLNTTNHTESENQIPGVDTALVPASKKSGINDGYTEYEIGKVKSRPAGDSTVRIWEQPLDATKLKNYNSSLRCEALRRDGSKTVLFENQQMDRQSTDARRYFDFTIHGNTVGDVNCYLRNEPKENSTKVVLFKDLKRVNDTDQFNLQLTPMLRNMPMGVSEASKYSIRNKEQPDTSRYQQVTEAGSLAIDSGYTRYKIGEVPARPNYDFKFNIGEYARNNAKFGDYKSSVTCKVVNGETATVLQSPKDPTKPVSAENPMQAVKDLPITGDQYRAQAVLVAANQEGEVHCFLRNEPNPKGSITILKSSRADGSVPLSGSGWKIEQKRGDSWVTYGVIGDNDANKAELEAQKGNGKYIEDANKADSGKVKIGDLPVGTYLVKEILPPAGFQITEEAAAGYEFTVTANDLDQNKTVVNPPADPPLLPLTGGWGTVPYMVLGFVLTGGAVMAFVIAKPKKRKN